MKVIEDSMFAVPMIENNETDREYLKEIREQVIALVYGWA
jgi:hypothetical protein